MESVFEYLDYQAFLRDFYAHEKERGAFFSYRYFGRRVGLDAGFLVKVLQGKCHLALKTVRRVASACRLRGKEAEYFDYLVRYGRASAESEIRLYFEKLMSYRESRGIQRLESSQYAFFQKWYHSAIRALIATAPFTGDYRTLARTLTPAITVREAKQSIALLSRLGLIEEGDDGVYRVTHTLITTGDKWRSAAIRTYQEETIRLAGEALGRHPKGIRDISTVTVAVSRKDFAAIRELAREFRRSVLQLKTDNTVADCVYQVNVQVFPLTSLGRQAETADGSDEG